MTRKNRTEEWTGKKERKQLKQTKGNREEEKRRDRQNDGKDQRKKERKNRQKERSKKTNKRTNEKGRERKSNITTVTESSIPFKVPIRLYQYLTQCISSETFTPSLPL